MGTACGVGAQASTRVPPQQLLNRSHRGFLLGQGPRVNVQRCSDLAAGDGRVGRTEDGVDVHTAPCPQLGTWRQQDRVVARETGLGAGVPGQQAASIVRAACAGVRGTGGPAGAGRRLRPGRGRWLWGAPLCLPAPWWGPPNTDPHGEGGWVVTPSHRRVTGAAAVKSPLSQGLGHFSCFSGT